MKVMIVDDEPLALRHMTSILSGDAGIEIIGACTDPETALAVAEHERPQLVFMDIEMPIMNGLEAAERLLQIDPAIRVVFATAYSHYALEAFELNALDYLLKPVNHERVRWALQRVQESMANLDADVRHPGNDVSSGALLRIMGPVELELPGQGAVRLAWRTQKSQELFLFLLQQAGKLTRKDMIIDLLWPDLVAEKAYANLYTTAYQLRKTLKQYEIDIQIVNADDGYWIEKGNIRIDAEEWEEGVLSEPDVDSRTIDYHRGLLSLSRGSYMQGLAGEWAGSRRRQLDALWIHHMCKVIRYLLEAHAYSEASSLCWELRDRHPHDAQSYELLMRIHMAAGDRAAAREQYKLLCGMLAQQFGAAPDPEVAQWYDEHVRTL